MLSCDSCTRSTLIFASDAQKEDEICDVKGANCSRAGVADDIVVQCWSGASVVSGGILGLPCHVSFPRMTEIRCALWLAVADRCCQGLQSMEARNRLVRNSPTASPARHGLLHPLTG